MDSKKKVKGRLSNKDKAIKQRHAEELFIRGMSFQEIEEIIGIKARTLSGWAKDKDWEYKKKLNNVSVSELKNTILEIFHDLKDGKTPKMTADQVSKLASAYEKLDDKQKYIGNAFQIFTDFTSFVSKDVVTGKIPRDKEKKMYALKYLRDMMQKFTDSLYQDLIHE